MKNKFFSMLLLVIVGSVHAQEIDWKQPIPNDPNVKMGVLKNGLTYYIRKNAKPEKKVDLRLVVNAGSILEDNDQQGLAHFMEHMNFNGTKHFPKNKLVDYLQSIGVKFGQHLNAYTSFDETVYFLPIPSDKPEKIENGFQILEDWAFNAELTPAEIDKERGVVLEEYRLGLGADKRMEERYLPKMLYKSHYADRMPIGKKEILEKFTYDKIVRFYKDWYRPNLMAVIVVGDIEVAEMEQKIIAHFSNYENPKNERPRTTFDVPNHKETFVAIESDKEATNTQVQLQYKDYGIPKKTLLLEDYKKDLIEGLFSTMLNNRLNELTNSPTPPFTYGYSYHGGTYARSKEAYQSFAMPQEGKELQALKVLVTENERVRKYGFTEGELNRAKTEYLSYTESAYKDREKSESSNFVWQCQSQFIDQEPSAGIEWNYMMLQKLLPLITVNDFSSFIKEYVKDDNRVVILTGPKKENNASITEKQVLETLAVNYDEITPYLDEPTPSSLLRAEVKPGSITKKESNEKLGTTTLFLSNGAKVTYKKTDFKNDEIVMSATSFGGSNYYTNEEDKKTTWAIGGLTEAGFSGLKKNAINKFMTGKIAYLYPYVSNSTEGFGGNCAPKDLEYLFQMIFAYCTDINLDKEAFEGYKQKQMAFYENMAKSPNFAFQQEFYGFLLKENPRFYGIIPTKESWNYTDYELAHKKFKERFSNLGDFEFFFAGNIDEASFETFCAKYIASLLSTGIKEKPIDLGFRYPKGDFKKVVRKGNDPKSNVVIEYFGETVYNEKEALAFHALGEVLEIKLTEQLRENESGVYGISAYGDISKIPYCSYNFSISFPCGPKNTEKLITSALREVEKIIKNGPEEKDITKFKEAALLERKEQLKTNSFWTETFSSLYSEGMDPEMILTYENRINGVTAKDIQEVAKKYLTKDKIIGVLLPESTPVKKSSKKKMKK